MCLDISSGPMEAKEDMTVYKHVRLSYDNTMLTPYRDKPVEFDTLIKSDIEVGLHGINKALHSFTNIKDAVIDCEEECSDIIVECTIPEGSVYYNGYFYGLHGRASNQIIYKKIVKLISAEAENVREKLKKYMI